MKRKKKSKKIEIPILVSEHLNPNQWGFMQQKLSSDRKYTEVYINGEFAFRFSNILYFTEFDDPNSWDLTEEDKAFIRRHS